MLNWNEDTAKKTMTANVDTLLEVNGETKDKYSSNDVEKSGVSINSLKCKESSIKENTVTLTLVKEVTKEQSVLHQKEVCVGS